MLRTTDCIKKMEAARSLWLNLSVKTKPAGSVGPDSLEPPVDIKGTAFMAVLLLLVSQHKLKILKCSLTSSRWFQVINTGCSGR